MTQVLIVYHTLGGNTRTAAEILAEGVHTISGVIAKLKDGLKAGPKDLVNCDVLAIGSPDCFSYMAGGLKDFFDRSYYPTKGKVTDKPVAIFVTHGGGGKAVESIKSICHSFKFRLVCEPLLIKNSPDKKAADELRRMGALLGRLATGEQSRGK